MFQKDNENQSGPPIWSGLWNYSIGPTMVLAMA
jgi:hypothetical protein